MHVYIIFRATSSLFLENDSEVEAEIPSSVKVLDISKSPIKYV